MLKLNQATESVHKEHVNLTRTLNIRSDFRKRRSSSHNILLYEERHIKDAPSSPQKISSKSSAPQVQRNNNNKIDMSSKCWWFLVFPLMFCVLTVHCENSVLNPNKLLKIHRDINIYKVNYENYVSNKNKIQRSAGVLKYNNEDSSYKERSRRYLSQTNDVIETKNVTHLRNSNNYNHSETESFGLKSINVTLSLPPNLFSEKIVKFAVILPADPLHEFSLVKVLPMIDLAVNAVTAMDGPLPGWTVMVDYRDSKCSSIDGPLAAFEFYIKRLADAFIGPGCEYVIAPVSRYAGAWKIPVLTAGAHAEAFQHKNLYPTLTRMMGSYTMVGVAISRMLEGFGWRRCGMIYHNNESSSGKGHSVCYLTLAGIFSVLKEKDKDIPYKSFDEKNTTRENYIEMLQKLSMKSRIVVVCASPATVREIMLAADELNMVSSGEYVFFNVELFSNMASAASLEPWRVVGDSEERNERARRAFSAVLTVTTRTPHNDDYLRFSTQVKKLAAERYNHSFGEEQTVSTFVAAFYDAVLLYALALNETIAGLSDAQLRAPLNGSVLIANMWNRTFKGITGDVTIDGNGDRIASYSLLDMHPDTGQFEVVANYIAANGSLEYVPGRPIYWAGGRTEPPLDTPVCGFDGSLCPDNSLPISAILSIVLSSVVVVLAILSVFIYRHYKLEAEIAMMTWRVSWSDVIIATGRMRGSLPSLARRNSNATAYSEDGTSLPGDRQVFTSWGFYKGCKVAIKKVDKQRIDLTRPLLLELKKMKDLEHDHLARFYGACVDPPHCCLLTEYCPKGSLQDILENDQFKLDWMFKVSLMHDIVRGMSYLHGTDVRSHGSLKSSNCVVDSRFVLKITDFGVHELRSPPERDFLAHSYWTSLLWTAPELLRAPLPPAEGTQRGDVYSFGIIVHEIVTRQGVFWLGDDIDKSPKEIVEGVRGTAGLRPRVARELCEAAEVGDVMRRCWAEESTDRPDFAQLKSIIRRLNKEHESGNILDNLLSRMEQYANNLESLVEERTADYLEEKKKCEELLYQLLPKSVASQLIKGQSVIAETYDQVTIYFSDIVGFTSLSAASTPLQVVDLLNDLYTCFDSIIENFDVYKVETIGDAYMVVSGLPGRNGSRHACEVARMSLALLSAVHRFVIRHRPRDQLKLRIGLHTGPCVAGVVGLKMPRYCLFGDTVNTASRMESNGEALRIHVSPTTKEVLDIFGSFDLECRGEVAMKGKGTMVTYWLNGEIQDPKHLKSTSYYPMKPTLCVENTPISHLTPFRQKRDQNPSRSSSRRGSAIFLPQRSSDAAKLDAESKPLLQDSTTVVHVVDANQANNGVSNEEAILNTNSLINQLNHLSSNNPTKVKIKENPNATMNASSFKTNGNKIGNNNWISRLPTANSFDTGVRKQNEGLKDFSSVPLLSNVEKSTDSIV